MNLINPELRIHAWGGLGSQLFAVALLRDLQISYPERRITIFLHTGGVTRRNPEVVELFPEISFSFNDDYVISKADGNSGLPSLSSVISRLLKRLLTFLSIIQSCDDDASVKRVRFWTRSIRGHYSYRTINTEFLKILSERLQITHQSNEIRDGLCSIHYRLGDLLLLENKRPLSPVTILNELKRLDRLTGFSAFEIFSDSPAHAIELLNPHGRQCMSAPDLDTVSVLVRAIQTEHFLGTSSKVSFWIAGIRSVVFNRQSSIPSLNRREISGLLNKDFKNIHFYGD